MTPHDALKNLGKGLVEWAQPFAFCQVSPPRPRSLPLWRVKALLRDSNGDNGALYAMLCALIEEEERR